jgi:hypothetical protein
MVQDREKTGVPRTDTRARVIRSSLELVRRRGYAGTANPVARLQGRLVT